MNSHGFFRENIPNSEKYLTFARAGSKKSAIFWLCLGGTHFCYQENGLRHLSNQKCLMGKDHNNRWLQTFPGQFSETSSGVWMWLKMFQKMTISNFFVVLQGVCFRSSHSSHIAAQRESVGARYATSRRTSGRTSGQTLEINPKKHSRFEITFSIEISFPGKFFCSQRGERGRIDKKTF